MDIDNLVGDVDAEQFRSTKLCRTCGIYKPLSEFGRHPRSADGLQYRCRECTAAYQREYQARRARGEMPKSFRTATVQEFTWKEYVEVLQRQGGTCAYCDAQKGNERNALLEPLRRRDGWADGEVLCLVCSKCKRAIEVLMPMGLEWLQKVVKDWQSWEEADEAERKAKFERDRFLKSLMLDSD